MGNKLTRAIKNALFDLSASGIHASGNFNPLPYKGADITIKRTVDGYEPLTELEVASRNEEDKVEALKLALANGIGGFRGALPELMLVTEPLSAFTGNGVLTAIDLLGSHLLDQTALRQKYGFLTKDELKAWLTSHELFPSGEIDKETKRMLDNIKVSEKRNGGSLRYYRKFQEGGDFSDDRTGEEKRRGVGTPVQRQGLELLLKECDFNLKQIRVMMQVLNGDEVQEIYDLYNKN